MVDAVQRLQMNHCDLKDTSGVDRIVQHSLPWPMGHGLVKGITQYQNYYSTVFVRSIVHLLHFVHSFAIQSSSFATVGRRDYVIVL